jgi:hypothetical protein
MNHEQSEELRIERFTDKHGIEIAATGIAKNLRHVVMRTCPTLGLAVLLTGLSGCMIVDSPIKGVLGTEVIWGDVATSESGSAAPGALKEGKACAESILGLLAHGDASVRAAKQNGNITEVVTVDHSARNFLNIVADWCTIVRGR